MLEISTQHRYYLERVARAVNIPVRDLSSLTVLELREWIMDILCSFKPDEELPKYSCFGVKDALDLSSDICMYCQAKRLCKIEISYREILEKERMRNETTT